MEMNVHTSHDNQFTNYSNSSVQIKDKTYTTNIIVTNSQIFELNVSDIAQIKIDDINQILNSDIIIFGYSIHMKYPNKELIKSLQSRGIGIEVMSIQALCRTFNFLISEDRKIACILIFT